MNFGRRWVSGVVALTIATIPLTADAAVPTRAALSARWQHANRLAIATMRSSKARVAAQRQFDATIARMRVAARPSAPAADQRALAARELASGRYDLRDGAKPPAKTAWQRFWEWAGAQWNRLMDALFGRVHLNGASSAALGDVLIALAVAAICWALVRFMMSLEIDRARASRAFTPLAHQKNARALYLAACALAQSGAFEAAAQKLFLAAITALDLRGVLHENPSATVGDMRRVLRDRNAALLAPFDEVAAPFVAATYAQTRVAPEQWSQAVQAYARLIAAEAAA